MLTQIKLSLPSTIGINQCEYVTISMAQCIQLYMKKHYHMDLLLEIKYKKIQIVNLPSLNLRCPWVINKKWVLKEDPLAANRAVQERDNALRVVTVCNSKLAVTRPQRAV